MNFYCQSLKEYMALYLLIDICLLVDVFQAFRNNSLNEYQLDQGLLCKCAATSVERSSETH